MAVKKIVSIIEEDKPSLKRIASEINRKFGVGAIKIASEVPPPGRIPTSSANLDKALGGGLPLGRIIELYGPEHSGKSLLSLLTIKEAQKQDLECVYLDVEKSFDAKWAAGFGVDIDKLLVVQGLETAEDIIDTLSKMLKAEPGIIVIDSVAAMLTRSELEEGADQQFMAVKARLLSRGLAKLNIINRKTMIILVNQIRSTLALYGAPTTTPGGNALKHFASVRLEIKRDSQLITESGKKTDPNVIGQVVNWKVIKNKTAQPYQIGSFRFLFPNKIED